ncbi:MAG: helix-turn-helix transcriptional regulator [Acidobacteria bacterium]|nr:helix-turn-helix transcriptional regulator [Acidobacteriota bacterium]
MNFGETIRRIRQRRGLSQGEMQKRTGILRSYLSRVENGHTVPSFATLQRLATAMEVTLSEFFVEEEERSPDGVVADATSACLQELRGYLPLLSPQQRQELLEMVKEMTRSTRQN